MQNAAIIAELKGDHHIHLAALGAPMLNVPIRFADEASKAFPPTARNMDSARRK
jgi:hypothetical protein